MFRALMRRVYGWLPDGLQLLIVFFVHHVPRGVKVRMVLQQPFRIAQSFLPLGALTLLATGVIIRTGVEETNTSSANTSALVAYENIMTSLGLPPTAETAFILSVAAIATSLVMDYINVVLFRLYDLRIRTHLVNSMMTKFFNANWLYSSRQNVGRIHNTVRGEAGRSLSVVGTITNLASRVIENALYIGVALAFTWELTLVLVGLQVGRLVIFRVVLPIAVRYTREGILLNDKINGKLFDSFSDLKTVKSNGLERRIAGSLRALNNMGVNLGRRNTWLGTHEAVAKSILNYSVLLVGILLASYTLDISGSLVLLYLIIAQQFSQRFQGLFNALQSIPTIVPSLERYVTFSNQLNAAQMSTGGAAVVPLRRSVKLENVRFNYPERLSGEEQEQYIELGEDSEVEILKGVNLEVPKGKLTVLVGYSGAGKTTILDLITGILKPKSGRVLVDGQDLQGLDQQQWRDQVSYMQQQTLFFNDTLKNNMLVFNPDADEGRMRDAVELAHATGVMAALPDGYETVVGERGLQLSGGQLQRLALARGLLKDFSLLVMDESTSNLDVNSEAAIMDNLLELRSRYTILLSAHRITAAMRADKIYLVEDGRVAEEGTPRELVAAKGRFYEMWRKFQLSDDDKEGG